MKHLFTTFTLFLCALCAHAQPNFKPATITYRDGSTEHGLIDYKEWNVNPLSILFQSDHGTLTLTPRNLSAFTIDGIETFETAVVTNKYSGDLRQASSIMVGQPAVIQTDTVFLRSIRTGTFINLYRWDNLFTTKFFVKQHSTGKFTELIFDIYFNPNRTDQKIITHKYIGQFSLLADDSLAHNRKKVAALLDVQLPYKEKTFSLLTDMLNGDHTTAQPEAQMALLPYAGLAFQGSWISYSGDYNMGTSKASFYPAVNAGLDLYPNRHVKRFRLRFNFGFSGGNFTTSKDSLAGAHESSTYTHKINMKTFSFSPQLLTNIYNSPALKVNAGIGATVNYSIYTTNDFSQTRTYYGQTGTVPVRYDMETFWVSVPVRAGVMLADKFDLFAQYNICISSLTAMLDRTARCSGFQLGVNYCF